MKNVQHKYHSQNWKPPCFVALHDFGHRNVTKLVHILAFEKLYLLVFQIWQSYLFVYSLKKYMQHVPYLSIFVLKLYW